MVHAGFVLYISQSCKNFHFKKMSNSTVSKVCSCQRSSSVKVFVANLSPPRWPKMGYSTFATMSLLRISYRTVKKTLLFCDEDIALSVSKFVVIQFEVLSSSVQYCTPVGQ